MCGITGLFDTRGGREVDAALLQGVRQPRFALRCADTLLRHSRGVVRC